ncbi:MAG: hypothetical protein K8R36_08270 [Planctomycetales bacterium]|nr:hypothetical protein [Planctomycetales bacterium]
MTRVSMTLWLLAIALVAPAVALSVASVEKCLAGTESDSPKQLAVDHIATLVKQQSAKPEFPILEKSAEQDAILLQVGASPDQIERLRRDMRAQHPIDGGPKAPVDVHDSLYDFLQRTESREWQELASRFQELLYVFDVNEITVDAASALEGHSGALIFPDLKTVSADVVEQFSKNRPTPVYFTGVTSLSPDAAASLAQFRYWYGFLPGLRDLSPEAAQALAAYGNGWETSMQRAGAHLILGLPSLEPRIATELAVFPRDLVFPKLETLTLDAATELAAHKGAIWLPRVETLDENVCRVLRENRLWLAGIKRLSPGAQQALACNSRAYFPFELLTFLTPKSAAGVAERAWPVEMPGIVAIDGSDAKHIAEALCQKQGNPIRLPTLSRISRSAFAVIKDYQAKCFFEKKLAIPDEKKLEIVPDAHTADLPHQHTEPSNAADSR